VVLVWASDITAVEAAASVRNSVVTAGSAASSQVTAATAATASAFEAAPHEAPLATLAIAGVLLLAFGA
jgi:hypothetical protein